jgi:hypothetical protein
VADFPRNLVAADQKALTGLNQDGRRDRLLNPDHMVKLWQKLTVIVMA